MITTYVHDDDTDSHVRQTRMPKTRNTQQAETPMKENKRAAKDQDVFIDDADDWEQKDPDQGTTDQDGGGGKVAKSLIYTHLNDRNAIAI